MADCAICNAKDFELVSTRIREGEGRIVKCSNCGLVTQDLAWGKEQFVEYYDSEYQGTNSLEAGKKQTAKKHFDDRMKTMGALFRQIKPLLQKDMNVLEIGCGAGALLSMIKPRVKKCAGIELNSEFVDFIQ